MSEKNEGGAGPALASHSKDASAKGPTAASSQTWNGASAGKGQEQVSAMAGQMRDVAGHAASSVSDAARDAGQKISRQSAQTADQAMEFVREQPLFALLATGVVCFVLGTLISRR